MKNTSPFRKIFLTNAAALGWIAVLFQLYLIILNRIDSVAETIIRYFSFFTVLTNILVALCLSFLLIKPASRWGKFFAKSTTITAITVYITIVGIVYNTILRFQWSPQGAQRLVDELLHLVMPVLFILYWVFFAPKIGLKWKNILPWLIYPFVYCVYVLVRGSITHDYPYPFMNVGNLGFNQVLINSCGVLVVFVVVSLIFVGIAKLMNWNIDHIL